MRRALPLLSVLAALGIAAVIYNTSTGGEQPHGIPQESVGATEMPGWPGEVLAASEPNGGRSTAINEFVAVPPADKVTTATAPIPTRPVATSNPTLKNNIVKRQEAIETYLSVLAGESPPPEGTTHGDAAVAITTLSVLTIMDAEGLSVFDGQMDGESRDAYSHRVVAERDQPKYLYGPSEAYRMSSGNARYEILIGQYPALDAVQELSKEHTQGVPIADLPLDDILALSKQALQYSVQ